MDGLATDRLYHALMPPRKKPVRRKKAAPASVGLTTAETRQTGGADIDRLAAQVEDDGGAVVGRYSDPFGGTPLLLAALPVDRVEPTPYQRDPSDAHVKRLMGVIEKIGRFLDPIVVVREDGQYFTPNGNHRLQALKRLGVKTVMALLVPDPDVAFKILALNTEKAHNLREKSLETIRMARALAKRSDASEASFAFEFEQPAFLTLGTCYEERPRLSGGAYQSILRRVDVFLDEPMAKAIKERDRRGRKILKLDDAVSVAVEKLKAMRTQAETGSNAYRAKPFSIMEKEVAAAVASAQKDTATAERLLKEATAIELTLDAPSGPPEPHKFNVEKIKQEDVAKSGGGGASDEE